MIEIMTKFFIDEFGDDTVPLTTDSISSKTKASMEEKNKANSSSKRKSKSRKSAAPEGDAQFGKIVFG